MNIIVCNSTLPYAKEHFCFQQAPCTATSDLKTDSRHVGVTSEKPTGITARIFQVPKTDNRDNRTNLTKDSDVSISCLLLGYNTLTLNVQQQNKMALNTLNTEIIKGLLPANAAKPYFKSTHTFCIAQKLFFLSMNVIFKCMVAPPMLFIRY